ncbi:hypothetical protein MKW94_029633, partial [Papaver nudicaule]|nr:hypothetical protein [Papaver nudicaule]
ILKLSESLSTSFPNFDNLTRLEVHDIHHLQMETFLNFLEFSPKLESLIIHKVEFSGEDNDNNTLKLNSVPRCLDGLKSLEIQKFNGTSKELELVNVVLKHARVLQTVTMETSYTLEDHRDPRYKNKNLNAEEVEALNKKITLQLGMSPWASAGCVIKFSSS